MKAFCLSFIFLLQVSFLQGQDHIFLREGDEVLECIILQANDSIITFRTLDTQDDHEYEIPVRETYGYLLENPKREALPLGMQYQITFENPSKSRKPIFRVGNSLLFRLKGDTLPMPSRGRISEITCDSIVFERRFKRTPVFLKYALRDIESFGYSTPLTESLTLIIAPISALQDGSFFIYRKLHPADGWTFRCEEAPDEVRKLILRKYPTRARKVRLPKTVRKLSRRRQP